MGPIGKREGPNRDVDSAEVLGDFRQVLSASKLERKETPHGTIAP